VTLLDEIDKFEYGKFIHILDPEGNKIELWEPVDSVFTQMGGATTKYMTYFIPFACDHDLK
jgi:hypothetical protein